jgi:hypothetical protein
MAYGEAFERQLVHEHERRIRPLDLGDGDGDGTIEGQVAATEHHEVLLRAPLQLGHGLARVALEERGVSQGRGSPRSARRRTSAIGSGRRRRRA